jgi:hypothetical protein
MGETAPERRIGQVELSVCVVLVLFLFRFLEDEDEDDWLAIAVYS